MSEPKLPSSSFARVRVQLVFMKAVSVELNQMCKAFIKTIPKVGPQKKPDLMEYLAYNGYISCLKYMHEIQKAKWTDKVMEGLLFKGDFTAVKYILENSPIDRWDNKTCLSLAMKYNCLDAIKYFHEASADWLGLTCTEIVQQGSVECLQYAHDHGCPWDEDTCYASAQYGSLDCLKYAHEHGATWTYTTPFIAAANSDLACLKYALENGCSCLSTVYLECAKNGNLEMMKYLYENTSVAWHEETCYTAAKKNHMDCLRYAYDNDAPFNDRIIVYACQTTECLQFVHDAGYGWNEYFCRETSKQSIMFSTYAHEQGWCKLCKWR